jgi:hypothetical protein
MIAEYVATLLTPLVVYFLHSIHKEIKTIGDKVEQLMINEAANRERLDDQERRITTLELKKHLHG